MKGILEFSKILKVFFDVRDDSDALYAHYGIKLNGIIDVQLMESANRSTTNSRRFLCGLTKCVEAVLHGQERLQGRLRKDTGERLWNPEKRGSYSVFNTRPLSKEIHAYCIGNVKHLPAVCQKIRHGTGGWGCLVAKESLDRVSASQMAGYLPHGLGRALSPWTPEQNRLLDSWNKGISWKNYFEHVLHNEIYGSRDEE